MRLLKVSLGKEGPLQVGARKICFGQVNCTEISAGQLSPRKVRQQFGMLFSPRIPDRYSLLQQGKMFFIRHSFLSLQGLALREYRCGLTEVVDPQWTSCD